MLTLGSLFDGIGGWLLAAQHADIKPLWRCEIDEYPRAVSEYHFPDVDSYGDIRNIHGNKIAPVDIICAGSPCQNLSMAGNRKGLQGSESSLFYESIRILKEMRNVTNGKYPRFFVWENVVGAFSSNHGNDFRAVLSEIGQTKIPMPESGRWATCGMVRVPLCDIAWRTLDAQYWGVPQRRKRIFLVADFAETGRRAAEILFEPEGVQGDTPQGEGTRESIAKSTGTSTYSAVLRMRSGKPGGGKGALVSIEKSLTLATNNDQTVFSQVKIFDMTHANNPVQSYNGEKCHTLTSRMGTGGNQVPVVFSMGHDERSAALKPNQDFKGVGNQFVDEGKIIVQKSVRKLTPVECERLQGLPDGYTDVEFKGKPAPDSRRYRALGNGMAQPCADFVLKQIVKFQRIR